ncbi:Asp-tRNA(Asn)/Glu-tRNA(Gln) amidotransferase subunit GatB [Anaerococcus sp. NML200537]|uniref:Asp-tRNA(Asn)/Glu-tRNA(Gln) amidotransferase subunit GatB n=1 Tax=Anaerococcus sp. NML200537 TaxID=2954485 RepID=UPI002237C165|nr:Asp-tRNA(Asn)/Glu-tRNA(Gln) amidotransferase subunit GatB [Anaerococcus sp. NML200537]MCW6701231.1 Asp-tRNA(Asn)/Glu-tRNA(Gln) amidotransferase subunit GatB [Anaerococcus sp. NML200537]
MKTKTIIGLEIHVELSTETKMFCSCKNEFGAIPNTNVCPICLGHPGTLPAMNERAVELAVMAGLAFNCKIRNDQKVDRKKYFYPDLVKGYQLTQFDKPYAYEGYLELASGKHINIREIHMEEDTGKSNHNDDDTVLMDYNRAGVPLIEIVTDPDISSPEEAREFVETLASTLKFLKVSDCIMAEGSMRVDVNVNLKDEDTGLRTEIAEIKNINSIKAIENALEFEVKRQRDLLENNQTGDKETRRWDDIKLETIHMRNKEVGNDYRFSADGDIPDIYLSDEYINDVAKNLPELPKDKEKRYIAEYGLSAYDANLLSHDRNLAKLFEETNILVKDANTSANWILTELSRRLNEAEETADQMKLSVENFAKLINLAKDNKINNNVAKKLLREIYLSNEDPEVLAQERNLLQISDSSYLEEIVDEVLSENPESIEDIKNGKDRAFGFLVGQAMKKTKGKGNPQEINKLLKEKIGE